MYKRYINSIIIIIKTLLKLKIKYKFSITIV